jgi:hypothetical protein
VTVNSKTKAITSTRIQELEAELAALKNKQEGKIKNNVVEEKIEGSEIKIAPDEYISVMSLIPFHLNLSTREFGAGKTYKFERFGQVKRIIYSDLVDIFETHPAFLEAGYFYVLSPKVLRHHGLEDSYEKILTKEKIEEILVSENKNVEGCIALYESANKSQQEVIVSFMVDKLVENPNALDLNFVDRITRISGISIADKAKDAREAFSPSEEK